MIVNTSLKEKCLWLWCSDYDTFLISEAISSILFWGVSSCLVVCLFALKPTMWACQGGSPGKCQLSENWGLLINRPATELWATTPLQGTPERQWEAKRANPIALNDWKKSWSKERERERENVSESDFPSAVTRSSDSFVAGSLSSRVWLPECIRGPVCNLTSQYWNSNASSRRINCCLVIGFQTCGTGNRDVLASLIMLCHGSWSESSNDVKKKKNLIWCGFVMWNLFTQIVLYLADGMQFFPSVKRGLFRSSFWPFKCPLTTVAVHIRPRSTCYNPCTPHPRTHTCAVCTAHRHLFCSYLFSRSFLPI